MVATLGSKEKEAGFENIDASAWGNSVEELNLHRMYFLLSEVKRQFAEIAIFTLDHEEKCLIVENRA